MSDGTVTTKDISRCLGCWFFILRVGRRSRASQRRWYSGSIRPCHGRDPGSIPGRRREEERASLDGPSCWRTQDGLSCRTCMPRRTSVLTPCPPHTFSSHWIMPFSLHPRILCYVHGEVSLPLLLLYSSLHRSKSFCVLQYPANSLDLVRLPLSPASSTVRSS